MTERYGQYELLKRLATGGMAQIYLARQHGMEGFERLCVVKRILPHLAENEEFIQMFLDEARIAARLSHTNIVQVFDLGHLDDSYFIAMEYIHGEDLRRMWRKAEAGGALLPIPFVLRVIADAASGLDYAHKRTDGGRPLNIVHRDISPQNILVSFEGTVKVVDFGIAKAADKATHTRSGVLKGKYSYMSPEQAAGDRAVDHRTDIFALGVVLYELLTGTRLFKRNNDVQTLTAVMTCEVAPPSGVNDRVPQDLDAVVLKALTRSADDRYPDAMAFQLALENWLISHQQPASTAHVAGYLKELYAERLAEEAAQGGPIAEEIVRSTEEDLSPRKRTPSSRSGRPSTGGSGRALSREASVPLSSRMPEPPSEPTTSLRPERSSRSGMKAVPRAPTVSLRGGHGSGGTGAAAGLGSAQGRPSRSELPAETSPRVTEVSRTQAQPKRTLLAVGIASALIVGAAALVWAVSGEPSQRVPPAQILVESDPPGATLVFDGVAVAELTPAQLPPRPPGQYSLLVGMADHREVRLTVDVPKTGTVRLPLVTLSPLRPLTVAPNEDAKDAGTQGTAAVAAVAVAVAEKEVSLVLATEPSGAQLTVDGRKVGASPATVTVRPGAQVQVRAELAGHISVEKRLKVGPEGLRETLKLDRRRPSGGGGSSSQQQQTEPPPSKAMGQVQFVIMPLGAGAEVSCGPHKLGSFPAPPKPLPVGTYDCTFTNPELGKRTAKVEVKANVMTSERVRFD